ncbi:MAG: signal peptidase II [Ruminococcus sp.]|nr:signal peptidase II [Ruminococcus sp.]
MYLVLILSAVVAAVDFLLKLLVINNLKPAGTVELIPGLFSLKYVENKGAAFGMLSNARWIFIVFTIVIIIALIYIMIRKKINGKLFSIASILIIGGGIGNLIDRVFYGYVVDYLSISFFPPVCNFADYCITIGAVLMVIYLLFFSDFIKKDKKND